MNGLPIDSSRYGDSLRTDTHGEDLCRVGPRDRAHSDSETTDEKVRAHDDTLRSSVISSNDPDTYSAESCSDDDDVSVNMLTHGHHQLLPSFRIRPASHRRA